MRSGHGAVEEEEEGDRAERKGWRGREKQSELRSRLKSVSHPLPLAPLFSSLASFYTHSNKSWRSSRFSAGSLYRTNPPSAIKYWNILVEFISSGHISIRFPLLPECNSSQHSGSLGWFRKEPSLFNFKAALVNIFDITYREETHTSAGVFLRSRRHFSIFRLIQLYPSHLVPTVFPAAQSSCFS